MDNNNQKEKQQAGIGFAAPGVALGEYANFALINSSASDFVFDFARTLPGMGQVTVCSRVIMTPDNAKRLLLQLQEVVKAYEANVGEIKLVAPQQQAQPEGGRTIAPFGDGLNHGQA